MRAVLGGLVLLAPALAMAEAPCVALTTHGDLQAALDASDAALAQADLRTAVGVLTKAGNALLCLNEPIQPEKLAHFARNMSLLAFYGQDEFATARYAHLARLAHEPSRFPPEMAADHPYREMVAAAPAPPVGGPEDARMALPKGAVFYLDGELTEAARAEAEVPHLGQVFGRDGALVQAWWQDGARFPAAWTVEGGGISGGSAGGSGGLLSSVNAPLAAAGGGLGLAAVGLYVAAGISAGKLNSAEGLDELRKARSTTNALVLGSGVAAVAGIGLGAGAFLVDGGGGLRVQARF